MLTKYLKYSFLGVKYREYLGPLDSETNRDISSPLGLFGNFLLVLAYRTLNILERRKYTIRLKFYSKP